MQNLMFIMTQKVSMNHSNPEICDSFSMRLLKYLQDFSFLVISGLFFNNGKPFLMRPEPLAEPQPIALQVFCPSFWNFFFIIYAGIA